MSTVLTKTESVRFDYPKDWIDWSREFRIKARSLNLWTYIEPDKNIPWPIQPIAPNMANYPKRAVRSETRGRGQAETPAPEQVDPRGSPTSIGEMTTEGKLNYQQDWATYTFLAKEYKDHRTNFDKMSDWITSTTSPIIRKTCCREDTTMDAWYMAFKETGSAYEQDRISDIRTRYQAAIKPLSKAPRKFNEWLHEWESAMAEGQELGLGDTTNAVFWAPDLARALQQVLSIWATNFVSNNKDKIQDNHLNYREVAAELQRHWSIFHQQKITTISKGAFPTFGATDSEPLDLYDNKESAESATVSKNQSNTDSRKRGKPKRKRTETAGSPYSRTTCKACLGDHALKECYYAFEDCAPEQWKPKLGVKRLVEDRIKSDNSLAEEIKRLRKAKDISDDS